MISDQLPLFPSDVHLEPTVSIREGESFVAQCSECGLLVCADQRPETLGGCPAGCGPRGRWWIQDLPVGPFHTDFSFSPDRYCAGFDQQTEIDAEVRRRLLAEEPGVAA